jgi:thiamine kinase-like enzyme
MVPRDLASRIERLVGAKVESYTPVAGGYSPAIRLLCRTSTTSFFAKVGATPSTSGFLRREIHVYDTVSAEFMPRVIAAEDHETAPILILEDLSTGQWPPPWDEPRVELVLARIHDMHHTQVSLASNGQMHGVPGSNWQAVAAEPKPFLALGLADGAWLESALPLLIRHEARCRSDGTSLTHLDLRSDNMCITERGVVFVDWNHACLSNPVLDLGFWLPSLAYEDGPAPEQILPKAPDVAARVCGFFAARAGLPAVRDAPRVRAVQRQQLEMALPWAVRALDLPPPRRNS